MPYKIPDEDEVAAALARVLSKTNVIGSQDRLHRLVLEDLRRTDPSWTVSKERMRRIALVRGVACVDVHASETDEPSCDPTARCPVCASRMRTVRNETVFGGEVVIEKRCPICRFWVGMRRRVPQRYVFRYDDG